MTYMLLADLKPLNINLCKFLFGYFSIDSIRRDHAKWKLFKLCQDRLTFFLLFLYLLTVFAFVAN